MPLRRFVIGAVLIGEDGVRDVTIAPRNDAAAVAIGSKSWPFDIRLRPWVFRPHKALLPWRDIAAGDVRPVATNGVESGRFHWFLLVLTGNMSDQVITVRCGIFFGRAGAILSQQKPIGSKPVRGRKAHGRSRISSARRKPTIFDAVSHLGSATATRVRAPGIAGE